MPESIIKATRPAPQNSTVKMSYTFLAMLIASKTCIRDVDMSAAICLKARNQKRNNPSHSLTTAFRIDANHLQAQHKFKTPVNSCRKTLHKGGCLKDTFLKYP